ncbi:MAG: transcriptional regulator [Chromatiales bacterium 21-64-14]|nr:MAG: transcriptional regulator [Chromatiales bacterium 21-64-14]
MNRAERIYKLHAALSGKRPVAMTALINRLGSSRATVVRDIAYLRDFMGAPVIYDREHNGHHYDPNAPEFQLPGLWFNDSELYALLASEQLLEAVQPGLLGPYIGPLKVRIRKLLEAGGHTAETVTSRVVIQPVASRNVDDAIFGRVSAAVLDGRALEIRYHGRERAVVSARRIHPYRLLHYRDNWYVSAWCERARALRTFSLDRILEAADTGGAVRPADATALDRHLRASFGIFTGEATNWAVLRFTPERARWVADERWHPDQVGQWLGETYELQIPYSDPRELLLDILKYGPDVEVVAPEPLRVLVAERLHEASAQYQSTPGGSAIKAAGDAS